jgi:hypothetical protein
MALNLDSTACFLLDVLDIVTAVTNDLRSEVEARDGLEIDGNFLFWPFSLLQLVARLDTNQERNILDQIHRVRPAPGLCVENVVHQQAEATLAS